MRRNLISRRRHLPWMTGTITTSQSRLTMTRIRSAPIVPFVRNASTGSRRPWKRTDMYISTLRSHIEAMGGQLEVIAKFPDGVVKISNFSELDKVAAA